MAVPFDLEALEVTGSPVPVLQGVAISTGGLRGMSLAVSDDGLLVHGISDQGAGGVERLTWVFLDGSTEDLALDIPQGQVRAPRISPDGTRVAYQAEDGIFVFVFDTGERIRVTRDLPAEIPVWSPDGSTLYFSTAEGTWYRTASDGSTDPERISTEPMGGPMIAMSPDGQWIVADDRSTSGAPDIFTLQLGEEPLTARPYLRADWHEEKGVLSPDGKWLAYVSNEDGGHAVYLRSFPEPGPKIRVSILGGDPAVWAPDGSVLYYRDGYGGVRARDVRLGETVELGEERTLFSLPGARSDFQTRIYDIHPDGDRFLFLTTGDVEASPDGERNALVVVVNWFEELQRRMEGG
jgi:dipeptidyl aminopeptidase/acylaminoacyl peptidase